MNPAVRLVLDTSAVRAYPHLNVGEPITQVQENGGHFAIPLPCLVAARDVGREALDLLVGHPAFRPADLPYDQWRQLAAMADVLGTFEFASALLLATIHRCDILTGEPGAYAPLGDDPPIIAI